MFTLRLVETHQRKLLANPGRRLRRSMISNGSRIAVGWSSFQSPHERYFDTHTVIILAQSESDVPIDLKTRRWLPYDPEQADALAAAISQVLEMYRLRPPTGEQTTSGSGD